MLHFKTSILLQPPVGMSISTTLVETCNNKELERKIFLLLKKKDGNSATRGVCKNDHFKSTWA